MNYVKSKTGVVQITDTKTVCSSRQMTDLLKGIIDIRPLFATVGSKQRLPSNQPALHVPVLSESSPLV
jgi:hypothetical protein